jgi:phosphatidylserine decarboxylase
MQLIQVIDWLKSWPLAVLPHHLLSRAVRTVTRWRTGWLKNLLIRAFIRHFQVDMSEAADPEPGHYPDFNCFFTRALRAGVRPQPDNPHSIACPVDGRISELGSIEDGCLVQAKGRNYSLTELLGGDRERATLFQGGTFATLYLSPRDYHRIHMPSDGRLMETIYIPGRLFSVAPHTTRAIPNLFTRNERLVALFQAPCGPMAVVMVGAIFVACMETVWEGDMRGHLSGIRTRKFTAGGDGHQVWLERGAEMGRFNMGSTVILLFGPDRAQWDPQLAAGQPVRLGQPLGLIRPETGMRSSC